MRSLSSGAIGIAIGQLSLELGSTRQSSARCPKAGAMQFVCTAKTGSGLSRGDDPVRAPDDLCGLSVWWYQYK